MNVFEDILIITIGISSVLALIGFMIETEPQVFKKNPSKKLNLGDYVFISSFVLFCIFLIELVAYGLIIWVTDCK